ncbi:MAG: hypothetical protein ACFFD2_01890 [Promethearchaeota archaeon]
MAKKTIDFENEAQYAELKAEAVLRQKNIGDFIIEMLKFWKEHHKEE